MQFRSLFGVVLVSLFEGTEAWICLDGIIQTRAAHRSTQQLTALNTMVHHVYSSASSASPWSRRAAIAGAVITPAFLLSDRAMGKEAVSASAPVKLGQGNMQYGGLVVPAMGVGAWSWGDEGTWNFGSGSGASEKSVEEAFKACVASGITFIDTAEIYGDGVSERLLGKLLASTSQPQRQRIQVATKYYPVDPKTSLPRSEKELITALDASLNRLQMRSVDLYQIHGPGLQADGTKIGEALAEAVKSGRCKAVGVSNFDLDELLPIYLALEKQGIPLASNQIEFSLLRQLPKTSGLIKACSKLGIGILAYSPLGMGRLTGKYDSIKNKAPAGRYFGRVPAGTLDPLLAKMREIGAKYGKTPAQVALNWLICNGVVPIPGAKNAKQATDNAGALGWRLSADEVEDLAALGYPGRTSGWQHDGSTMV